MATSKSPHPTDFDPLGSQTPATVPAGVALDTQIGLEAFRVAESQSSRAIADTQPMGKEFLTPREQPAGEGPVARSDAGEDEPLDVATAMVVCRRNGRAAPKGLRWAALVAQFQTAEGSATTCCSASELARCTPLQQRAQLRQLLMLAHDQNRLAELLEQLASIPEGGWSHMGD